MSATNMFWSNKVKLVYFLFKKVKPAFLLFIWKHNRSKFVIVARHKLQKWAECFVLFISRYNRFWLTEANKLYI